MVAKKSQEESEQPAKVYQLDAVADKVDNVASTMKTGFDRINASVDKLILQNETRVTPQQLTEHIVATKKEMRAELDDEISKVHLVYKPLKDNNRRLLWGLVSLAFTVIGQIVVLLILTGAGR